MKSRHPRVLLTAMVASLVGQGAGPAATESRPPATAPGLTEEQAHANLLKTSATMFSDKPNGPILEMIAQNDPSRPFHDDDLRNVRAFRHLRLLWIPEGPEITDDGISNLSDLKELEHFELGHSQVTGASLSVLAVLPKLNDITLTWDRKIDDQALAPCEHMTQLRFIDLTGTRVTGAGLKHLEGLKQLGELHLDGTSVSDGLEHLTSLPHLRHLWLGVTGVGDDSIKPIEKMAQLAELQLDGTHITDKGLVHVEGLGNLELLDLENTDVTDAGLVHLKRLQHLGQLWLTGTHVTPAGIAEIQHALPDCRISAAHLR
jgi:hypothetical protein